MELFEGTEKKLEIITRSSKLRTLPYDFWVALVEKSQAQILSKISTSSVDAYLLSESSLFVFDNKIVMITCGQTLLIESACFLINHLGKNEINLLVFERKNEILPSGQFTSFEEDVQRLRALLPDGKIDFFGEKQTNHIQMFSYHQDWVCNNEDFTLEVLMSDIDTATANLFIKSTESNECGDPCKELCKLWEGFQIDGFQFDPLGYSLNGIKDAYYFTIHITPQEGASYVSFETNYPKIDPRKQISQVANFFKPQDLDIFLFHSKKKAEPFVISEYENITKSEQDLQCGYDILFQHLKRMN